MCEVEAHWVQRFLVASRLCERSWQLILLWPFAVTLRKLLATRFVRIGLAPVVVALVGAAPIFDNWEV
jgi:hypothetical protein